MNVVETRLFILAKAGSYGLDYFALSLDSRVRDNDELIQNITWFERLGFQT